MMRRWARSAVLPLVLLALWAWSGPATAQQTDEQPQAEEQGNLFINLTSDSQRRAGMALSLARAALERGHDVTVYLNVEGVRLASTRFPHELTGYSEEDVQETLQAFIAEGGQVIVCPRCMQMLAVGEDELIDGVTIGAPDITFPAMFGENTQVISY